MLQPFDPPRISLHLSHINKGAGDQLGEIRRPLKGSRNSTVFATGRALWSLNHTKKRAPKGTVISVQKCQQALQRFYGGQEQNSVSF